jgi:hypothetical protein
MGSGAKSYMRKGFLIYAEMRKYLVIYEEAVSHNRLGSSSILELLIYEENFVFFFYQCILHTLCFSEHYRCPLYITAGVQGSIVRHGFREKPYRRGILGRNHGTKNLRL